MKGSSLYILILLLCTLSLSTAISSVPSAVTKVMASRQTRYHHFLWHNIRNLWNRFDSHTQNAIRNLGWAPPRPSQRFTSDNTAVPIEDNNSGEDFFYMHRQMIAQANSLSSSFKVVGWTSLPDPSDPDYPVASSYTTGNTQTDNVIATSKTNSFFATLQARERKFKDPNYLRNVTLGQLGAQIEFQIHNWLHIRWSRSSSMGYRVRSNSDPLPDVNTKWDDPNYLWLVDNYASQVNPYFWKIHGWVDDRIEDWRRANGLKSITWKGTWVGGSMSRLDDLIDAGKTAGLRSLRGMAEVDKNTEDTEEMEGCMGHMGKDALAVMEEVVKIVMKTGLETKVVDRVVFEDELSESEKLSGVKNEGESKN